MFVCDQNRLRSPTAKALFENDPRVEVRAAGVRSEAIVPVTRELLEWADLVLVMERSQRNLIHKRFKELYASTRIVCLYIEDEYEFMDPVLVRLLRERIEPHLGSGST